MSLCTLLPWPRMPFLVTLLLVKSYPSPLLSPKATFSVNPFGRALCPLPEKRIPLPLGHLHTIHVCVLIRVCGSEYHSHPSFPLLCELFTEGACSLRLFPKLPARLHSLRTRSVFLKERRGERERIPVKRLL